MLPYCTEHYWCNSDSINVFNVVGTEHPDYIGLTWREFISVGKRMRNNLELLKTNPSYYAEKEKKNPSMYYTEIDGKLYVAGDGNHRTAIAKFYYGFEGKNPILHGVDLNRYSIAYEVKNTIMLANSTLREKGYGYLKAKTKRVKLSREDTAGWMKEIFAIELIVENVVNGREVSFSSTDLVKNLEKLKKKSIFSPFLNRDVFVGLM